MNAIGQSLAGAVLGLALCVSPALAQTDFVRPVGPYGPGRCAERLVAALDLTAAQQAALDTLREETAEAIEPIVEQLRTVREQIDGATTAASPDPCAIGAMAIQAAGLRAQIASLRKAADARFVATLSTEQKARYENFVAMHPGCMAVGGGFFGPPPRL
jgi:Spy/CpxP family protein refolding chaperone